MVTNILSAISKPLKRLWKIREPDYPPNINMARQYIFIHIPKNGGTSVAHGLGYSLTSHRTALQYKEIMTPKDFSICFKFCFTRNPWARFLSLYNYARMTDSLYHSSTNPETSLYGKHLDYDLLHNATLNRCAHYLQEGKLRHDTSWNHWHPQVNWIQDTQGTLLTDFIGKVENMAQDFHFICEKLSLTSSLSRHNTSGKAPRDPFYYRSFYDQETKKIVADYYQDDIDRFGYDF
ncbi:MAG: sulfotransferase family protein [Desulfobulbaceae bacterium]|nr:sulfotransferase family protein [Desulfobulbaceae bacterium]